MDKLTENNFTNNAEGQPDLSSQYLTASAAIGDKVYDENNEPMGDIKDIMMNVKTGGIHYYVIKLGGFLGIGAKYFAIPHGMLRADPASKRFVFTQSKEVIAKAPGFNRWHWPDTNFHLIKDTSIT
jgi:sporulation protein YlmC with PRC-barrel domain